MLLSSLTNSSLLQLPLHLSSQSLPVRFYSSKPFSFDSSFRRKTCSSSRLLFIRASMNSDASEQRRQIEGVEELSSSDSHSDSYIGLFVRMLGLDNDPLDREQAITALWKYSQGGKRCIDKLMKFRGYLSLTINLLKSDVNSTCEAAAGLLRVISAVSIYRDSVAKAGAIEEINGLLRRSSLNAEVKEQSLCTLWNLSIDDKYRMQIANSDLLPLSIKFLDDKDIKVQEAAGGVLANLALSQSNHSKMVEAGVIPKMSGFLLSDGDASKIIRKEAKNVLLELAKDAYYRILITEEGLVHVPMVGKDAYQSIRPISRSWPSLPDGTEFERKAFNSSRYGASELLLGLNIPNKNADLEEAKMKALIGRTQQQFLARIGAIELEEGRNIESVQDKRYTLLPWVDGIARLVLILELEDSSAIRRAAQSIADASINEHMRTSFAAAGAVKVLINLLDHDDHAVKLAAAHALERLSMSHSVYQVVEAGEAANRLLEILKLTDVSEDLMNKSMSLLAQIFDPSREMKNKVTQLAISAKDTSHFGDDIGCVETRKMSIDSDVIVRLIHMLKVSTPNVQHKVVSILEHLVINETEVTTIIDANIESGLHSVFKTVLDETEEKTEGPLGESFRKFDDYGLAVSAASRLLTNLLKYEKFKLSVNCNSFISILRRVLKTDIPFHTKDWVAACLIRLQSSSLASESNVISTDIILYKTIPRLIDLIRSSSSLDVKSQSVIELNNIISEGVVDCTRVVASEGIVHLVELIDVVHGRALEATLAILYNLSMDSENHSALISAGVVPALRRIVTTEGPYWMEALHLLRTLPI